MFTSASLSSVPGIVSRLAESSLMMDWPKVLVWMGSWQYASGDPGEPDLEVSGPGHSVDGQYGRGRVQVGAGVLRKGPDGRLVVNHDLHGLAGDLVQDGDQATEGGEALRAGHLPLQWQGAGGPPVEGKEGLSTDQGNGALACIDASVYSEHSWDHLSCL